MDIRAAIDMREITSLFHFTPMQSLLAIFEVGELLSRDAVESSREWEETYLKDVLSPPDRQRLDGFRHLINTSITVPNIHLLRSFRRRMDDSEEPWCILELRTDLLLRPGVLFSVCNAASSAAAKYGIQGGISGFENIFRDIVRNGSGRFTREGKKRSEPTDLQAEALIPSAISVKDIKCLHFESFESQTWTLSALGALGMDVSDQPVHVTPNWFL